LLWACGEAQHRGSKSECVTEQSWSPHGSQEAERQREKERERECLCYELSPFLLLFYLDLQSMGWFHTFRPCLLPLADPPWKLLTDTPRVGYTNLLGASQSNQVDNQD
jgi:hypothetical protein